MIKRIEPEVTDKFRKDPDQENFLARLNHILAPHQEEDYIENLPERFPTVHVIGAPRSGTTLLTQVLAAHTNIGYINNLIAAFWKAPVYGIRLSAQVVPRNTGSSYQSEFGRTKGIHEPHEFGYFWSELLDYQEMREPEEEKNIDWEHVRLIFTNMTRAYGGPILFKSLLLAWHIPQMQMTLPKTCWLHIRRDPIQNSLSLLRFRHQFLGSVEKWGSLKPKEYEWLANKPYWEQVAGQVYFLEKRYREQLKQIPKENILSLTYEELCNSPGEAIKNALRVINRQGASVSLSSSPPDRFKIQKYDLHNEPDSDKIMTAWVKLNQEFGQLD